MEKVCKEMQQHLSNQKQLRYTFDRECPSGVWAVNEGQLYFNSSLNMKEEPVPGTEQDANQELCDAEIGKPRKAWTAPRMYIIKG